MPENTLVARRPRGILRWFLRAPITMYRLGLGGLLGGRFILINHVGRKSGKTRQTVLEVVAHDQPDDIYYVASGWGYKSDWYRNLLAQPNVTIQVGRRKLAVTAENVPAANGAEVLLDYRRRHASAAKQLGKAMGLDIANASADELVELVRESVPLVGLHVMSEI